MHWCLTLSKGYTPQEAIRRAHEFGRVWPEIRPSLLPEIVKVIDLEYAEAKIAGNALQCGEQLTLKPHIARRVYQLLRRKKGWQVTCRTTAEGTTVMRLR